MAGDCSQKNPLIRSGTHQLSRFLQELNPEYFQVDERSLADLVQFAQRYARHLKYYDSSNIESGDWEALFNSDITAVLAGLSNLPVESFRTFFGGLQNFLTGTPARPDPELSAHFKLAFHLPLMLLEETGRSFARLPRFHPLRAFMAEVVKRDVDAPLKELLAYYKGVLILDDPPVNDVQIFDDTPLDSTRYNTNFNDADPRIQLPSAVTERINSSAALSGLAIDSEFISGIAPTGWTDYYNAVTADPSPYLDSLGSFHGEIFDALHYGLLVKSLERLYQASERMAAEALLYLQDSLDNFSEHTPHYGLWLAFLQLFAKSQSQINQATAKHLDYYYKEILQLGRRPAQPNQVHILFELNKNQTEHLLPSGTLLKAGKDDLGKEAAYQLDSDLVVNRGAVSQLKSLFRPAFEFSGVDFFLPYAAEVTNSRDGLGEDLPKEDPQWKPFGPFQGQPNARIGFAISDRQLFLREGKRTIVLTAALDSALPPAALPFAFKASLTAEEGWLEIDHPSKLIVTINSHQELFFVINLDGEDPAVIPYDSEIHGGGFEAMAPIVKIEWAFGVDPLRDFFATLFYPFLKDVGFNSIQLRVAAQDLRQFTLQNEAGILDTAKPFLPFGATPQKNSPLILGSRELFSKRLDQADLHVTWEKALTTGDFFTQTGPNSHQGRLRHLSQGKWQGTGGYNITLFSSSGTEKTVALTGLDTISTSAKQELEDSPFDPESDSGFVRLELESGFEHAKYIDEKTLALIDLAASTSWSPSSGSYNYGANNVPKEPYTPKILGITASYSTADATPTQLYHLYPFGQDPVATSPGQLFPALNHEGELYIGVSGLEPPQRLTLLFQTVDGSANPLKNENQLQWHYLQGDEWTAFAEQDVDDKTNNLTGSGIIGLAVPEQADTSHRILTDGLHWFRMSVSSDADALNNLLSIDPQAGSATFLDQGNDPGFVATPLAAGTISKLKISDAAIKKIEQPYESFGGRAEETSDQFYTRVSERLRHKDRAATMWDYEHLVLQEFPRIYKVKCINHTELCRDADNEILADNELKPGHVLVVPLPYVTAGGARNPLRPYTDKKTLIAIDQYLRDRISPFVQLEVQNPKIEEVQVKFDLAFTDDIADLSFYKAELVDAIIRFLTPWAYEDGAEVTFGGKWHKSAIINFVEEQSYVHYVKNFEMYHKPDISLSDSAWGKVDVEVVKATTSRSILVSHSTHIVQEI